MRTVAEVMTPVVHTVRNDQPVAAARDLMLERGIHAVPVVDDAGALCGIVTSTDLLDGWPGDASIAHAMTPDVRAVGPLLAVEDAALAMLREEIHHLVVTEGHAIVGICSSFDLLRCLADTVREMTAARVVVEVGPGDELVVTRPDTTWRGRLAATPRDGRPPFEVVWSDDPDAVARPVVLVRRDDIVLDACER